MESEYLLNFISYYFSLSTRYLIEWMKNHFETLPNVTKLAVDSKVIGPRPQKYVPRSAIWFVPSSNMRNCSVLHELLSPCPLKKKTENHKLAIISLQWLWWWWWRWSMTEQMKSIINTYHKVDIFTVIAIFK